MHRQHRWAAAVVFAMAAGSTAAATSVAVAATTGTTLYVNNTVSACSDSGSGTEAAPYCNPQAAFSAVKAGGSVIIEAGKYTLPATFGASGTAAAPIAVDFGAPGSAYSSSTPEFSAPSGATTPQLSVVNASYVTFNNANVYGAGPAAVAVAGSSHVTFTGGTIQNSSGAGITVSGASSDTTVERLSVQALGSDVSLDASDTGTLITTNLITRNQAGSSANVAVNGAAGTDVIGNTINTTDVCGTDVSVAGGATDTTLENNVLGASQEDETSDGGGNSFACDPASLQALNVDAASAGSTTEKYDDFFNQFATSLVWAGTTYIGTDAFQAATGQGANDVFGVSQPGELDENTPSFYVDSADALAPGEPSTDLYGNPREDDPNIPNTGSGAGYYDRGAVEETDTLAAQLLSATLATGSTNVVSVNYLIKGGWGTCESSSIADNVSAAINWGDGSSSSLKSAQPCSSATASAASAASPAPAVRSGLRGNATVGSVITHTYPHPGTYGITLSAADGTVSLTRTASFTTLTADYSAYGPTRILDTRKGVGASKAAVAQGSYVRLKVAGNGGIPADVSAVALNLTVTDATGNGYVAAQADGAGKPSISNLNYLTGQTVANAAIVSVGSDGYIDVYNVGTAHATADLIADVTGYFRPAAGSGYAPATLSRILDTRKGIGAPTARVPGDTSVPVMVAGVDSIPTSGVTAVALHVTVTDTVGNGWIAAVPDGSATPTTSSLNYLKGQTVSNTVIVPVPATGEIRLYNGGSTTPVDLIADVAGYFSADAPNAYVPLSSASRVVDTRASGGTALQPNSSSHYWIGKNANVAAMVGNLTVTQPTANGFITAYPDGVAQPTVSNVNFLTGQTTANLAMLDTNTAEQAATNVHNSSTGTTELIIDVFGYFAS